MNKQELYQWQDQIRTHLGLGAWQSLTLAAFSLGVMETRRCTLSLVSEGLSELGKADSVERRLQRWLSNQRLVREQYQGQWLNWVLSKLEEQERLTLLVDETKLSEHLHVMLVGVAWQRRCIPL